MLHYLTHQEIDKVQWDASVDASDALVYNYSWFLDALAPSWHAIVQDNYNAILPLAVRKKWGLNYVFPPFFAQQLGIVKNNPDEFGELLQFIPHQYKYVAICIPGKKNPEIKGWNHQLFSNYVLDLNNPYKEIFNGFSNNTKRNIKKAQKSGLYIDENMSASEFFDFIKNFSLIKNQKGLLDSLSALITASFKRNFGKIWACRDKNKDIHAVIFFIQTKRRTYYLCPLSSEIGKDSRAMFLMLDSLIHQQCGKEHSLDFQGSNVDSIARFYQGFNALNIEYSHLTRNTLPWPIKLFKT